MPTLAERIKRIRTEMDLSGAAFGRLIGISRSAVNQLEDGTSQSLKAATVVAIEKKTGYRGEWILNGRGPPRKKPGDPSNPEDHSTRIFERLMGLPEAHRKKIEAEIDFLLSIAQKEE